MAEQSSAQMTQGHIPDCIQHTTGNIHAKVSS